LLKVESTQENQNNPKTVFLPISTNLTFYQVLKMPQDFLIRHDAAAK